jgi:membrane associated rhomboid family serine protease
VTSLPPDTGTGAPPHCYRHPDRETYIACQRCGRPICPDCMGQASVGFHCPECIREARAVQPRTAFGSRLKVRAPIVTSTLIAINVLVFVAVNAAGGINSRLGLWLIELPSDAGYVPGRFHGIAQGAYWELITSTFTHVEILHIAMNMIGLWIFGSYLEVTLGRWRFLALYLVTGLVGSVGVYLIAQPDTAAYGASGSVFGLFACAFIVLLRQHRDITQLVVLIVLNLVISFAVPNIAWQAHLGGLLSGLVIGAAYAYAPRQNRTAVHVGVLVLLVAVSVVAVAARTAVLT